MKAKILKALREVGDGYLSGAVLCEKFGVSRQAIWKNIATLKEIGYEFESVSNKGYKLIFVPDTLYGPEIESRLPEASFCKKVISFDTTDSTNLQAKKAAELGEPEGTIVVADEQTAGRGRRGRDWDSVHGTGIYMSILLRPQTDPDKVSCLTLLAALAVSDVLREDCGVQVQIKWPNDIVIGGKKLCGILTEMSSEEGYINRVVVGIGINANMESFPEELQSKATSVFLETGQKIDRAGLTAAVAERFGGYYLTYMKNRSFREFLEPYNDRLVNRDKEVKIYYGMIESAKPEEIETGIARGIDENGALLVEVDGQVREVVSGEVSVRGVMDYV